MKSQVFCSVMYPWRGCRGNLILFGARFGSRKSRYHENEPDRDHHDKLCATNDQIWGRGFPGPKCFARIRLGQVPFGKGHLSVGTESWLQQTRRNRLRMAARTTESDGIIQNRKAVLAAPEDLSTWSRLLLNCRRLNLKKKVWWKLKTNQPLSTDRRLATATLPWATALSRQSRWPCFIEMKPKAEANDRPSSILEARFVDPMICLILIDSPSTALERSREAFIWCWVFFFQCPL